MPQTIIRIKTWVCPHCKSSRDTDPNDQAVHDRLQLGAPLGVCHFCWLCKLQPPCGQPHKWEPATDLNQCVTVTIAAEEDAIDEEAKLKIRAALIKFRAIEQK